MRKALIWLIAIAMAMTMFTAAVAESASTAVNGEGAVRTNSELYTIFSDNGEDVLIRTTSSGDAVCVDRADVIDGMVPYAGGIAYLKTNNGSSSIVYFGGSSRSVMYSFDSGMICENLSVYNDDLLVLSGNLLYSVDPNDQICLKLSGAQILDYCVSGDFAYFMSGTDMMQYSADITENGETVTESVEVGCIYRLDLTSGETMLMLKSGGTDPKIKGDELYFHSMQQIYAVRENDEYELRGRLYSLNISEKNLNAVCSENDDDYWPLDNGVVARIGNSLNLLGSGAKTLYEAKEDAQVVSDGSALYVWEPAEQKLTRVTTNGQSESVYTGAIGDIRSLDSATPVPAETETPEPVVETTPEPTAVAEVATVETASPTSLAGFQFDSNTDDSFTSALADTPAPTPLNDGIEPQGTTTESAIADSGDWFDEFMDESDNIQNGVENTLEPGVTPTPQPIETIREEPVVVPAITAVPDSYLNTTTISSNGIRATGGSANMRIGPGTDYDKIGAVLEGDVATSLGLAAKASNGTTWYKVYYNGMTGWISSKYSEPTSAKGPAVSNSTAQSATTTVREAYTTYAASGNYVHITGGDSNIRSGASTDYTVLTSAPNGTYAKFEGIYAINESGAKWYKLTYNGVTGWVSASLAEITEEKASSTTTSSSGSGSSGKVKTTGNVTIRSKPDKTSKKLGYIDAGVSVKYLGSSSVDSRGVRWYKIRYDGITGWISSKYSKLK